MRESTLPTCKQLLPEASVPSFDRAAVDLQVPMLAAPASSVVAPWHGAFVTQHSWSVQASGFLHFFFKSGAPDPTGQFLCVSVVVKTCGTQKGSSRRTRVANRKQRNISTPAHSSFRCYTHGYALSDTGCAGGGGGVFVCVFVCVCVWVCGVCVFVCGGGAQEL